MAILARVLPFYLAFCHFSLHFSVLACILPFHHHPNFYNFFPIAIAPFRMGNRGKFRMVDIFDTKAVYTTAAV